MKAGRRKAAKPRSQQLRTLMSVRKPLPPATRIIPDSRRAAVRKRIKRIDPSSI